MRRKTLRWGGVVTATVLLGAFWFVAPQAGGQVSGCQLAAPPLQPDEPLEMNTVLVAGDFFKTVVMEKEVFVCDIDQFGNIHRIVDVETFIEIIESVSRDGVKIVTRRVEVAECEKNFDTGVVSCKARDLPPQQVPPNVPVLKFKDCPPPGQFREVPPPSDPVEMNTVAPPRLPFVKTIKVEKEVFFCGDRIVDLYLFTEIIETKAELPDGTPSLAPVVKQFSGIVCQKIPQEARVEDCRHFTPPQSWERLP